MQLTYYTREYHRTVRQLIDMGFIPALVTVGPVNHPTIFSRVVESGKPFGGHPYDNLEPDGRVTHTVIVKNTGEWEHFAEETQSGESADRLRDLNLSGWWES